MSRPCRICSRPCPGKRSTCSPECRVLARRADQQHFRERQRGGPRRCVVCGSQITAPTATITCSQECRRAHRLGVPVDQLPPLVLLASEAVCDVCGITFRPRRAGQRGCSAACQNTGRARLRRARMRQGPYPSRACVVCGQTFQPDRHNGKVCGQTECRAQRKRDLANARTAGQLQPGDCLIFCTVCGAEVMAHHCAVTCARRECVRARRRQVDRQRLGVDPCVCIVCGERFWPPHAGAHYTCSPRCQVIARKRRCQRGYERCREERLAAQAERLRSDPEYRARRQEIDRQSRERRRQAEQVLNLAQTAAELQRRHDGTPQ